MKFTIESATRFMELTKQQIEFQHKQTMVTDILRKEFPGYERWSSEMRHDAQIYLEAYESFVKEPKP